MDEIRCPMCGKPNPASADNCQFCDARIKLLDDMGTIDDLKNDDLAPPAGSDQPDTNPVSEGSDDWPLEDFGGPVRDESDSAKGTSTTDRLAAATGVSHQDNLPDDDLPDYLMPPDEDTFTRTIKNSDDEQISLGDSTAERSLPAKDDLPEWLSEVGDQTFGSDMPDHLLDDEETSADIEMDWLGNLDVGKANDESTSPPDPEDAPKTEPDTLGESEDAASSWLEEAEAPAEDGEAAPAWLGEIESPAEDGDAAPAWLEEVESSTEDEDAAPAWLGESETPAEDEDAAPAWLGEAETPAQDGDAASSWLGEVEAPAEEEDAAPSWLGEVEAPAEEGDVTPAWLGEAEAPAEGEDADPSWLGEIETPAEEGDAAPAWLGEVETPAENGDAAPAWLGEVEAPAEDEDAASSVNEEAEAPAGSGKNIPDWLSEIEEESILHPLPSAKETNIDEPEDADWLAQPTDEPAGGETIAADRTVESTSEISADETSNLDWLADPVDDADDAVPDWLAESTDEPAGIEISDADWLTELADEPPADETSDADWLAEPISDTRAAEISAVDIFTEPVSKTLAASESEPPSMYESDSLQDGEGEADPAWLKEVESPDGSSDIAPSISEEAEASAEDRNNIPDWFNEIEEESPSGVEEAVSGQNSVGAESTPEWLLDEGTGDLEDGSLEWLGAIESEPGEPAAVEGEIPEWLQQTPDDPPQPESAAEAGIPDWAVEAEAALPPAKAEKEITSGVPEWLIEYEANAEQAQSGDWLSILTGQTGGLASTISADSELTPLVPETQPVSDSDVEDAGDLPGIALAGAAIASSVSRTQEDALDVEDAPSWLDKIKTPAEDGDAAPSWLGEDETPAEDGDAAPSWLGEVETPAEDEDAAPTWLGEIEAPAEDEAAAPSWLGEVETPAEDEDAAPSWLEEVEAPAEDKDAAPSWPGEVETPAEDGDAAPSWLGEVETPAEDEDAAPTWLGEVEAPAEDGDAAPSWLGEVETPAEDKDAASSWLEEIESPAEDGDAAPTWLGEVETPAEDKDAASSWLEEIESPAEDEDAALFYPEETETSDDVVDEEELPDWLAAAADDQLAESGDAAVTPTEIETAQTKDADLPDWLEGVAAAGLAEAGLPDPAEGVEALDEVLEEELPDWLMGTDSPNKSGETVSETEATTESSWLGEVEVPAVDEDAAPSWLGEIETPAENGDAAPSSLEEGELSEVVGGDLPNWMSGLVDDDTYRDTGLLAGLDEEEEVEAEQLDPPDSGPLPNWLEEPAAFAETARAEPVDDYDDDSLEVSPHPLAEDGLVDWSDKIESVGEEITSDGKVSPEELPGWLQAMRPVEVVAAATAAAEDSDLPIEKAGPLAGLRGVVPGEEISTQFLAPPVYSSNLKATDRHRAHFALLEALMAEETRPRPVESAPTTSPARTLRMVVGLVMIFILLIPLLTGTQQMPLPTMVPVGVQTFYDLASFNLRQAGAPILLAVDYEPAYSGEIGISASGFIEQVIRQQALVTLVSTSPTGPALGEDLLNTVRTRNELAYDMDRMMVNLGYLSGGSASLQAFALDPARLTRYDLRSQLVWGTPGHPALNGINSLSDYFLVIVLTDNPDTARGWIEQVEPLLAETPLLMITSAQAAPMIAPYSDSGQVDGIVSGLSGGVSYELLMGQSGQAQRYWDAYQIGLIIAVTLTLAGALYYTLLAPYQVRGRRRRKG